MKKSTIKPIDEALKEHYASKALSENQLDQLLSIQRVDATSKQQAEAEAESTIHVSETITKTGLSRFLPDFKANHYALYETACLLFACLALVLSLINQAPLSERIMDEIAYNHKQDMPIEVASSSLSDIGRYLNKLSFPIITPSAFGKTNWQFLGGRYCSINGKLAAQLKVKNLADNNIYTLYQAASESGLDLSGNAARVTQMIDGVGVSIWREKGLLLGLASSP